MGFQKWDLRVFQKWDMRVFQKWDMTVFQKITILYLFLFLLINLQIIYAFPIGVFTSSSSPRKFLLKSQCL